MRVFAAVVICVIQGLVPAAGVQSAQAGEMPGCESRPDGEALDIRCPVDASESTRRLRLKANFSGSHDDTRASMTVTLDGSPLACEEGSKTFSEGEDGEVSLECRFSAGGKPGTKHLLGVKLSWRHAQYTDFQFTSE